MGRVISFVALAGCLSCVTTRIPAPPAPRLSPVEVAERLAEADRLAARGCYLCLKEAAAAFAGLLDDTDDPAVAARALENNLMLAMREAELRMPDSGARESALELQSRVPASYARYFDALEFAGLPRERRVKLVADIGEDASASAMKAYFFLATALQVWPFKELKHQLDGVLAAHPRDLSLRYRMLAFLPAYDAGAARDLIGQETGFGEVHLLMGQAAVMGGNLASAHRELTRARELLPDSISITFALAQVTFSYARYSDALALFDRVIGSPVAMELEAQARLGRAKSLSYLKRHDEAIALLGDLLQADPRANPGEKYYWRGWNRLQLGQAQAAYDDATEGLNGMQNDAIYRLAGMASFGLNRLGESRAFFEEALTMNRADCDSERYLGLLDSTQRSWAPAQTRFSSAASCYEVVIARMRTELADLEKDITGLSNALIAAKRLELQEADALRSQSLLNAATATKNAR